MPIVVVLFVSVISGGLTAVAVRRFPALDPAAPRVPTHTVREVAAEPSVAEFVRSRLDPQTITGLLLTTALAMVLGAAIAVGALVVMAQHDALLARYDLSAARWGAANSSTTASRVLRDVSLLGGTPVMIAVSITIAAVEYARTRLRAVFLFVLVVVLGQVILVNLTKYIVDRPRPDIERLTGFSGSSFPSGHAATASATFAAVAFLVGRGRTQRTKAVAAGVAVAIATAVATTRIFLGVHWFTDVLAGLAIGWGWFALCSIAFGGRLLRFGKPLEVARAAARASPPGPRARQDRG